MRAAFLCPTNQGVEERQARDDFRLAVNNLEGKIWIACRRKLRGRRCRGKM
jgi:hypothetical protein